ncbi:MAG: DedA family protein [Minisyncoccia bacterium]|jgi:membrane protein DedA with SNARE-associated domain
MPPDVSSFLINNGYLAIFLFVFSQEIGVPNPIPNELVILFSGYLAYSGLLSLPLVILTIVAADFIGTSILYLVFYLFGEFIMKKAPRWIPVHKIELLRERIDKRGKWALYVGRLITYARGYVSVGAGLIGIPPRDFLTTVIWSSVTWGGGYAIAGWFLGPVWQVFMSKFGFTNFIMIVVGIIAAVFAVLLGVSKFFRKRI